MSCVSMFRSMRRKRIPTYCNPIALCQQRNIVGCTRSMQLSTGNLRPISSQQVCSFPKRSMVMITTTKSGDEIIPPQPTNVDSSKMTTTLPTIDSLSGTQQQQHSHHLVITDSCWKRIQQLASKKNKTLDDMYMRVFVDAGGCSGFTYQFELEENNIDADEDIIFVNNETKARVVVDQGSYELIKGSKIDYVQEMIKSTFEVKDNPQSESACGCGSSFAIKNFSSNPALH
jgi:iron-sulfur cluster assembly accessory protein